ncbi:MAG: transposase family protein [Fibrobacter sp.]|nr:transposase family protein [Fibrobacter sp.]
MLGNGASQQKICNEVHCSKRTVSGYYKNAQKTHRSYDELLALSDGELSSLFMPIRDLPDDGRKDELDRLMPEIAKRLERKHATIQFVYEDFYSKQCPNGYRYTQFKNYLRNYRKQNDYSYHNEYDPGKEWQIDFAGDALYITDYQTKQKQKLVVLVCIMPYSQLAYMMAMPKATTDWSFYGLNQGLVYMDALPQVAKSDNMKQWVNKSDRYSLAFSEANVEWALYYGIEPTACRVRKPRDKGPVESAVNQLYKYVYARLEGETYYSLESLKGTSIICFLQDLGVFSLADCWFE